jgi:hypothetical protein
MKIQCALAAAFLALAPVAATAETQEEQQACMNDAFTVCGDAIPDREKVGACLARNINRISAPCRTVMLRYQRPATAATTSRPAPATNASKGPMNIRPRTADRSAS